VSGHASFQRAVILMAALALTARQGAAQRVSMRVGYRLTFIGDKVAIDARVVDNSGRPVPNAPLAFRVADPAVAGVSARGEVVAKRQGSTRVWAVYGRDSASSLILVEQWASKFAFAPTTVRLDAIGAKQALKVLVSDAAGVPVAGETSKTSPCRSVNERVATLTSTGEVVAVGNGSTYVRCADKGIADSVKIDVQQRAVSVSILNKSALNRKAFGDTFSVRISPKDRQGKDVVDARPTWASLNPAAVSIEPLTGKARAVNSGDAKIIVQIGDVADSTTISVTGGPVFSPVVSPTTPGADAGTTTSKAGFTAQDAYMFEHDTSSVQATATDSLGALIPNAKFKIRLGDISVAKLIDSVRVVALKPGTSKIYLEYGGRVDSAKAVFVRQKSEATAANAGLAGGAGADFKDPAATFKDTVPKWAGVRDSVFKEIHTDPRTAAGQRNLVFSVNGVGAIAEHLSHPTANVTEDRTGVLTGGAGTLSLYRKLELGGTLRLGTLSDTGTVGEALAFSEAEGSLGIFPVQQVGIRVGYMLRTEKTTLSTQKWTIPKVSLVTRFSFIGDVVNTYAAFSLLPKATFTGAPTESPGLFSRAGEVGLELRKSFGSSSAFNAGLTYYVEQFNFDNSPRLEEFSAIRFRLGLQRGW
jgi:hypothetical protein